MHKLDFRKYSKSGWNDCHQECFKVDSLFTSPPCIPDYSGGFRRCTKWLRNFADEQDGCEIISQPKADFAALRNWPSTWSDLLPMALTSSFQLRFANHLKRWIVDFLIFETTYSMYKLDFRKCSKSGWNDCHQECFMVDFLFTSPPCILDFAYGKEL